MPFLMVPAWGQVAPQGTPSALSDQPDAAVDSLYKMVMARHPLGIPDLDVFGPYLSKKLRHEFDLTRTCFDDWRRKHPNPDLKPPVSLADYAVFSGGNKDADPQTFHIEKAESDKDGSYRVYVKFTWEGASNRLTWYVAAVVVRENGRPVVDDVLYLKGNRDIELRLSELLKLGCQGSR
ncbi:MAG: hypothetical protein ABI810_14885 [Sphingomonas bacterium]